MVIGAAMGDPEDKKKHPVQEGSIIIGNLAFECRQRGYSLRLLACLMDTPYFGVVYGSMISAKKGRGGDKGRTHNVDKAALAMHAGHIQAAMKTRGITDRKWTNAYGVDLLALVNPERHEWDTGIPVLEYLQEDFPEVYGLTVKPYTHAYCKVPGFWHIKSSKKKLHVYESPFGFTGVSHNNGQALHITCKMQGFSFQAERLRVLLSEGPDAALAWLPSNPEKPELRLTVHEQDRFEKSKRESEIEDMINQLAALNPQYLSQKEVDLSRTLNLKLNNLGVSNERIKAYVISVRLRNGQY
jgi:hypothetical protein